MAFLRKNTRTMNLKKNICAVLFLIICTFIHAQQVRHLGYAEGLNGRQALNFAQDKEGFIWISTKFGVDRYDGKNVKNYSFDILNNVKNPMREVHILFDNDSVLWAFTDNGGIHRYDEKNDRFVPQFNLKFYLKTIFFDHQNTLWVGTYNSFGFIKNKKLTIITNSALKYRMVRKILPYNDDVLIIGTTNNVHFYNKKTKKLSPFFRKYGIMSNESFQIESAYFDAIDRKLWLGTSNSGVVRYDLNTKSFQYNVLNSAINNPIISIYPIDKKHLVFGSDGAGAILLEKYSLKVEKVYMQQENSDYGLAGNEIYDIFKDKVGRLWLSTYSDGVNIIESRNEGFSTLRHEKNNPNSLLDNVVRSIMIDKNKNVWYGSKSGITIWNKSKNSWKRILLAKNVLTILEDSNSDIWVGTFSSGVYVLDKNGNILKHYYKLPDQTNTIGTNFVYTIFEDSQKNIWIGGIKGPLAKFDRQTNTFKHIQLYQINNIILRNKNELLVATTDNLFNLKLTDDSFSSWKHADKLTSLCILDMYLESDSIVWLCTYGGGLNKCNLNNGSIQQFTVDNGLSSNIVYSILKDNNNNLWVSTENGLSKVNVKNNSIINFSTGDGISSNAFRPISRAISKTGELFFGSYNGTTYFNPDDIVPTPSSSKLVLTDFNLFNRVTHPGDKNSPLKDKINNTKKLDLSYKDHSFSLAFTTIDFAPNAKRRYMWKLEGLDKDWVGPSSETVVNYTNLTPKTYTFKLKAIGDNNIVLDQRELEVVIHPPFWNTIIAKILGFILLILFSYWAYKYISNYYEKKRTTEKIKFFINTTHDLRTPLTLISSPIYELKEKLELDNWNKYLFDLVTSNLEKMNKMVSQLLDFQKTYESKEQLIVTKNNINKLIADKKTLWKSVAERKNISLRIDLPDSTLLEWFDKEKMDKILDNLISNAIKYTRKDGTIDIKLSYNTKFWTINVIDNGIGIPKSAVKKLFHRFYRAENAINSQETGSGLGLLLIKSYVALHKGKIGVNSTENQGSDFYVRFKRGRNYYTENIIQDTAEVPVSKEKNALTENENFEKQKIKLLIVEDNNDLREYIKLSLSHYYITFTAENGQDAWEKIPAINPDIIITDYNMPIMNGFELCGKIKKTYETSHIPVVLLTVMNGEKEVEEGLKLGADDYIQKPFDVKYLKLKIENIIANRKILRSKFLEVNKPNELEDVTENDLNTNFLIKATKIAEDHVIDTEFSISDFSKEMGMSRSLLYTKFNAITGYSPNDFVKIIRMKKAVTLFKDGIHNINEVAAMTGFDEPSYFTTCFKKIYGKSPKQFINEDILKK